VVSRPVTYLRLVQRAAPVLLGLVPLISSACVGHRGTPPHRDAVELAPGLELRALAVGVWLHTTWREYPGGSRVPSNGLVVADRDALLLIDSAWGDGETMALVEGVERELGRPVTGMVATHHHDDRLSGSAYLHERGIRVVAHPRTGKLARSRTPGSTSAPGPSAYP